MFQTELVLNLSGETLRVLLHTSELILQVLNFHIFVAGGLHDFRVELFLDTVDATAGPLLLFGYAAFKLLLFHLVEVFHLG